jgi:transcriptional regulator with XRE-family HTH domain
MRDTLLRIGDRIKNIREQSGLTQSTIAKFLEVDQSLISKIEKNERPITSDMLDKLSTLFGIDIEEFTKDSEPKKSVSFAFRACKIDENDLQVISDINRIALNLNFMTKLMRGKENDR